MALREMQSSGEVSTSGGASAVSELATFWNLADSAPRTESEEWWDFFMVAINAKYSISVTEVLREVTEQHPRVSAFINNLKEQEAERKIVSVLFLSLGSAARKSLTDKFPHMRMATIRLREKKQTVTKPSKIPETERWKDINSFHGNKTPRNHSDNSGIP